MAPSGIQSLFLLRQFHEEPETDTERIHSDVVSPQFEYNASQILHAVFAIEVLDDRSLVLSSWNLGSRVLVQPLSNQRRQTNHLGRATNKAFRCATRVCGFVARQSR